MNRHEEPDQSHRDQVDDRDATAHATAHNTPHRWIPGEEGKKVAEVDDEALECGRDGGGKPRHQRHPRAHEPDCRAVRFAEVHVLRPRAGHHGSQLRIAEGTEQCEGPADHPQHENERRVPEIGGLEPRGREDSRADHVRDHEGRGGLQAHVPLQGAPVPSCGSDHAVGFTPAKSANSRHFQRQSTSSNPFSRSQSSCVSTSRRMFDSSS